MSISSATSQSIEICAIANMAGPAQHDDENLEEMAGFFSLRKPKNAKAGLASGSKNFVKGVVAGAVNLVAAPVIGAQQEGLKGFAMGVGAGMWQCAW